MLERDNFIHDPSLQDNQLSCSLKTYLEIAEQLGEIEFKLLLDDRIPFSQVSLSVSLFAEVQAGLDQPVASVSRGS